MTLAAGVKLGPYEILAPLGAGGMGEVYRARDTRLGREVAVKVLPASFTDDADRLRRFEQEARAAGLLNHPNITAVYDIGSHEGAPYVVQELLEGETLRAAIAGVRLSPRRAVDYALQVAQGLAAAHDKGIVHRDLKPENVFLTKDGRIKILDFGLAKLTQREEGSPTTNAPTVSTGTEPGVVMGTLAYMSPEQVRGRPADARSDIFAFGAILYEMLSGKRAFHGDSAADTMSAILREDPPDLSVTNQSVSPGLERIVRHCLEKSPEQRFQSARDLAFDLMALTDLSVPSIAGVAARRVRSRRRLLLAAGGAAAAAIVVLAFWAGRRSSLASRPAGEPIPVRQRLTFRRGNVLLARFTADGQQVVYGAAWGEHPAEIFLTRIGSPETRPLGIANASLLSVSKSGELAILLKKSNLFGTVGAGTLARVPLAGGTPRQLLENVLGADWAPDGENLAVVREIEGKVVLEYPIGKRIYSSNGLGMLRVSPDGNLVAAVDSDPGGFSIALVDRQGHIRVLTKGWFYIDSFAWTPSGNEIWLAGIGSAKESGLGVYAVNLSGRARQVAATLDLEAMHDIAPGGRVLVEREINTRELEFARTGEKERDLSWLEESTIAALSSDGRTILFTEFGEGGGPNGSVYLRTTDGAPAVRLGDGQALDLSPDGKSALTLVTGPSPRVVLLPTGAGEPRTVPTADLHVEAASFLPPDGRRLLLITNSPGQGARGYVTDPGGANPRPFTPAGLTNGGAISPDGKFFAANGPDERATIYPVAGGPPRPLPGLEPGEVPTQWSADGGTLFVGRYGEIPTKVYRYGLESGKKELWKELVPADRSGLIRIESVAVSRNGSAYAYTINRVTDSDLFLVTGWK